jgi:hypothetical protein
MSRARSTYYLVVRRPTTYLIDGLGRSYAPAMESIVSKHYSLPRAQANCGPGCGIIRMFRGQMELMN